MKRWQKEVLWASAIGAAAVALILVVAWIDGARFEAYGPNNGARGMLLLTMLPALISVGWLRNGEDPSSLVPLLFWSVFFLSFALPAWCFIRALRPTRKRRAYSEEPLKSPAPKSEKPI